MIDQAELDARIKEQAIENPGSQVPPAPVLAQLARIYIAQEILKAQGLQPSETDVEKEARRIETTTLQPERLAEVKALYSSRSEWKRYYVLPVLIQSVVYKRVFKEDASIQKPARQKAVELKKQAETKSFESLSKVSGSQFFKLKIDPNGTTILNGWLKGRHFAQTQVLPSDAPENVRAAAKLGLESNARQQEPLILTLSKMKVGSNLGPLEDEGAFSLIHLLAKRGQEYTIETLNIPKISYKTWFETRAKKIPTECVSHGLCEEALKRLY